MREWQANIYNRAETKSHLAPDSLVTSEKIEANGLLRSSPARQKSQTSRSCFSEPASQGHCSSVLKLLAAALHASDSRKGQKFTNIRLRQHCTANGVIPRSEVPVLDNNAHIAHFINVFDVKEDFIGKRRVKDILNHLCFG